jgi:hypothetical protein
MDEGRLPPGLYTVLTVCTYVALLFSVRLHQPIFQGWSNASMKFQRSIHMATYDKGWSETTGEPKTKAEFYQLAGITPELIEFVEEFIERPELFESLPLKRQREIEAQMDTVLAAIQHVRFRLCGSFA